MDYFDGVLIKLKRAYSKDETVAALSKQNSELQLQIGALKDEIDFLKSSFNVEELEKEIKRLKGEVKGWMNTVNDQKRIISQRNLTIRNLQNRIK